MEKIKNNKIKMKIILIIQMKVKKIKDCKEEEAQIVMIQKRKN
jgi:hypothetical protein